MSLFLKDWEGWRVSDITAKGIKNTLSLRRRSPIASKNEAAYHCSLPLEMFPWRGDTT